VTRVLYFSRDYTPHDFRFLAALAKSRLYSVSYLRLENCGQSLEDRPLPPEIKQISWAGGIKPARLRDSLRLLLSLQQVIQDEQPEIIQAGPLQTAGLLVALTGFRRLVSMSWGYDLLIDAERNWLWRWATRFTLRRSAAMVGDCATIRQRAIQNGMHPARIVTFPWGVNLAHFSPGVEQDLRARQGWNPDHFVLLSTRGWAPIYGVEELARGFVMAARERPQLRLVMLGGGPQAARLRQIFQQGGVLDSVRFPGQVRQVDLPRYYRMADLYVSASHSDGSSISLLEALACGRVVLVSDIPGNQEWVNPGEQGWWFREGDPVDLASKIVEAVDRRAELINMGIQSRQTAEQRADWELNFPRLFAAYQIALNQ
jgi:L-malate glycosyltransferase